MSQRNPSRPPSIIAMSRSRMLLLLIWGIAVALAAALFVGAQVKAAPGKPVSGPPSGMGAKLTFSEDFAGQNVDSERWVFAYYDRDREQPTIAKRNLWGNRERQIYFDKDFLGLGIDPFSVSDGTLAIESRPLTETEIAAVKEAVAKEPPSIASTSIKDARSGDSGDFQP